METVARQALISWMAEEPETRTQSAVARSLWIRQASVSLWVRGASRPDPHLRKALEILTSGAVRERDWMTAEEVALIERVSQSVFSRKRRARPTTGVQQVAKPSPTIARECGS